MSLVKSAHEARPDASGGALAVSWTDDDLSGACVRLRETPCPSEPGHLAPMRSELQLRACSSVLDWLGLALIDVIELDKALDGGRGGALRVDR